LISFFLDVLLNGENVVGSRLVLFGAAKQTYLGLSYCEENRMRAYFNVFRQRILCLTIVAISGFSLSASQATAQDFINGFETDTNGWNMVPIPIFAAQRVPSGDLEIPSASGGWHASGILPVTNWGETSDEFPVGGFFTTLDIYLDVNTFADNDSQLYFSSSINDTTNVRRRNFVFNIGFYNDGPGSDNRFVMSASNNVIKFPNFPREGIAPVIVDTTGWYTFTHIFRDSGSGVLEVEMTVSDASGTELANWTLNNSSDVIDDTVGGNGDGGFSVNDFGFGLAFDNSAKLSSSDSDGDGVSDADDLYPNSDVRPTVIIDGHDSGVENSVDPFGCTINDLIQIIAESSSNHGAFVRGVAKLTNALKKDGLISGKEKGKIQSAAAQSSLP
jgi:hypothetical protein